MIFPKNPKEFSENSLKKRFWEAFKKQDSFPKIFSEILMFFQSQKMACPPII